VSFAQHREPVTDRVEGQGTCFAFHLGRDQCCVDGRREEVGPVTTIQRSREVIENELYRQGVGPWAIPPGPTVAQLQPSRPVGEGAAVAAHGIGSRACGDKGLGSLLSVVREPIQLQRGINGRFHFNRLSIACNVAKS
jgi:hypothetical protein